MTDLSDLYQEVILDHYKSPKGKRPLATFDTNSFVLNPVCGDEVKVEIQFESDKIKIKNIAIISKGCAISVAAGSILFGLLLDKTIGEAEALIMAYRDLLCGRTPQVDLHDLKALEGVKNFPARIKCALVAAQAIMEALEKWKIKP